MDEKASQDSCDLQGDSKNAGERWPSSPIAERAELHQKHPLVGKPWQSLAFITGCLGNAAVVLFSLPLFSVPSGTAWRDMGFGVDMLAIGVVAFVVGLPLAIYDMVKGRSVWGSVGFILCLLPIPLSSLLVSVISSLTGFWVEP